MAELRAPEHHAGVGVELRRPTLALGQEEGPEKSKYATGNCPGLNRLASARTWAVLRAVLLPGTTASAMLRYLWRRLLGVLPWFPFNSPLKRVPTSRHSHTAYCPVEGELRFRPLGF